MNAKCKVQIEKRKIWIGHFDVCILQSSFCNEFLEAERTPLPLSCLTTLLFLSLGFGIFSFDIEGGDHVPHQKRGIFFKRQVL
jgi:hypothetical protein